MFVGYGNCEKGYRLFNVNTQKVIISRDVVFDEKTKWSWENSTEVHLSVPFDESHSNSREYQE